MLKEIEYAQKMIIRSRDYDLIILDEANIAVSRSLISPEDLIEVMDMKPVNVDLVITGRYADEKVIEKANLVTEMKDLIRLCPASKNAYHPSVSCLLGGYCGIAEGLQGLLKKSLLYDRL